jgi:hypothetical protein
MPAHSYCGGAAPPPINVCRYDQCDAEHKCPADTGGALMSCVPRGFLGARTALCQKLECVFDVDCAKSNLSVNEKCLPFASNGFCRGLQGFFCVNPEVSGVEHFSLCRMLWCGVCVCVRVCVCVCVCVSACVSE